MTFFNSKRHIAAAALGGIAILASAVGAYAYWTSSGSGSGSATTGTAANFTVTSVAATGSPLTPDGPIQTIAYTVTNPTSGTQQLNQVAVSVATTSGTAWGAVGCSALDFKLGTAAAGAVFTNTAGLPTVLASGGAQTGSVTIQMASTASSQDACKSVTVPLYFVVS